MESLEDRMALKKKREDCAGKMMQEKGDKMSKADMAFVKTFAKKDAMQSSDIPKEKAKQILKEGQIGGKPLTEKQKGLFGAAAGKGE